MKQHVFKRKRLVNGKRVSARTYSGRYRLAGDLTHTEVSLRVTDKQAAQAELARIVRQAERERLGLALPVRQIEAASAPLDALVREWIRDLVAKRPDSRYPKILQQRMGIMMRECPWRTLADIDADSFMRWRGANGGRSAKTLNDYLGCASAFLNWLIKARRLEVS